MSLLILSACGGTVDVPEPKEDGPVFIAEVDTESDAFNWQAGRKNYEAIADYIIKGNDLTFISRIKDKSCDRDCPSSLSVSLESAIPYDRSFRMEDAITLGTKVFTQRKLPDSLIMSVSNLQSMFRTPGRWTLNGKNIKFRTLKDSFIFNIPLRGVSELCLTNQDDFGNQYAQCQTFSVQDRKAPRPVIQVVRTNDIITLKAIDKSGLSPGDIEGRWSHKNQRSETIRLNLAEAKDTEICYTVKKGGSQAMGKACVRLTARPGTDFRHELDFQIQRIAKPIPEIIRSSSSVDMTYVDQDGKIFSSSLTNAQINLFEIIEIDDFVDPVLNIDLRKVKCRFSGELVSQDGQMVKVRRANLVLPFAVVE